jgi:hypothetical protein
VSAPELDEWLAGPAVRVAHRREAGVTADELWAAAARVRLSDTRRLGQLVRWRIPGLPDGLSYMEMFRSPPFVTLDEDGGSFVAGLCGRIWTLRRDYPRLASAEEFRAFDTPGTVRVLYANWVAPLGEGRAAIHSETRVRPVDRGGRLGLMAVRPLIGAFQNLIASEALGAAVRAAEHPPA